MSLPEHVHRVRDDALHQIQAGGEASPAHCLCRPVLWRGRWWVWCLGERCDWVFSSDREADMPTRCEVEQLAAAFTAASLAAIADYLAAVETTRLIARRERDELQKLLRRSA